MPATALRVDGERLLRRLAALGSIGDTGDGGVCRLALTDDDRDGRDLVVSWMDELGLRVEVDAIGNVVGTWPADATDPAVMMGSHIDTVRTGGRYDGNLGVLAGLEVIETVRSAGVALDRPLAVAFFTDEEGSRFAPDMLGSLVRVGGLTTEAALDIEAVDGTRLVDELERIGYAGPVPCPAPPPAAFVELHIEQGPVLEREGVTIGAVTGVQGISWTEYVIEGQSNHAGTTPMSLRHDPGYVAAQIAVFVRGLANELGDPQVGTTGLIELHPNFVNVIPAQATIVVDLRNTDDAVLRDAEARTARFVEEVAAAEGVTVTSRVLARFGPVQFDPGVVQLVEATAAALGHSVRRMPSGAGHDAQMLARVCPSGMVFVPSIGGVSHNPAEATTAADLVAGADVFLSVVLALAGTPPLGERR
jgi:beta-ureidopropionase / N-carbamoyl-L-amino-acid hydrolase